MHTNRMRNRNSRRASKVRARARVEHRVEVEIFLVVGMVLAALLLVSPAMAQEGEAKIRMAHLSPDAPPVMVEVDGEPVEELANVAYQDSTPYLPIPAGPHEVSVYAVSDPSEPVLEVSVVPEAGKAYTVAGSGLLEDDTFGARLFEDDLSEPEEGEARVRVIHAVPDVGPATVSVQDGPELFSLPGFANASDYVGVEAGTYTLEVTPAGDSSPAFDVPDVEVEEGEIYTAFAVGQASEGTLGTILTVDSDDGRIVGSHSLEETSGDPPPPARSPEPRPERASSTVAPASQESETAEQSGPEESQTVAKAPAEPAQPEDEQAGEPQPQTPDASEVVNEVVGNVAPVEAFQAPVETFQTPVEPATYVPPLPAEPAEVVPTAQGVVSDTLATTTGYVPDLNVPVVPELPVPTVQTPQVPAVPNVGSVQVSATSTQVSVSAQVSTQTVTNVVTTSGLLPPATNVVTQNTVTQNVVAQNPVTQNAVTQNPVTQSVTQQTGGLVGGGTQLPTGGVVGNVVSTPAVLVSEPRRRFVTIRRRDLPGSA